MAGWWQSGKLIGRLASRVSPKITGVGMRAVELSRELATELEKINPTELSSEQLMELQQAVHLLTNAYLRLRVIVEAYTIILRARQDG